MRKEQANPYYPVFLNVAGRRCMVAGGGQVALRKVQKLLECGAIVEVVSPRLCAGLEELAACGAITVGRRAYKRGDIGGAFLAVAATGNSKTNGRIEREANSKGVLLNVVDDIELSSFIVPSYLRRGDITIAVSTAGHSPALARRIRARIEKEIGPEYALLAEIAGEVRRDAREKGIRPGRGGWQKALDIDSMLDLMKKGQRLKAKRLLVKNIENACKKKAGG